MTGIEMDEETMAANTEADSEMKTEKIDFNEPLTNLTNKGTVRTMI